MALKPCKECGTQVSTKARQCPKCGAARPKSTSLFTWLVTIFVAGPVLYSVFVAASKTDSGDHAKSTANGKQAEPTWYQTSELDEMTGETSYFAHSPSTTPTKPLAFPHHKMRAWLGFGCKGSQEWAYIGFNIAPIPSNKSTKNGYDSVIAEMKWDSRIEQVRLIHRWSSDFIGFDDDASAIRNLVSAKSAMLGLDFHGDGRRNFAFDLTGSSQEIKSARNNCR